MINLKILRLKRSMSQQELADKLGVNVNTVSRWEVGATTIPVEKLILLADMLEVTTDYLLGRE